MSTSLKNENKPLLVGLTGGIGSGKTTVAKIFKSLGVPIFNSDVEAKNILNTDVKVIQQVVAEFGEIYSDGKLNTKKMAELVFNNPTALEKLNKIIHPKVAVSFIEWVKKNNSAPALIKEAAILIESGAYKELDKIILVTAPEEIRIQRVINRDNVSAEKVESRMKAQLLDEEKKEFADFTITNDEVQLLIPQVLEVSKKLKSLNQN